MSLSWRKKQTVRERIDDGAVHRPPRSQIYSTLSRKPADLNTTDVDLTAIRIFLSDGTHRTISSSPDTTCGDILDSLLRKLGLSAQRDQYGLQIKYTYSDSRIADDKEKVAELNPYIWDSIERIFLSKKEGLDLDNSSKSRKRVAKFSVGTMSRDDQCSTLYENAAVSCRLTDMFEEGQPGVQPSLLNEELAGGFARAWTVGTELHKAGESGGQRPIQVPATLEPIYGNLNHYVPERASTYSSYTLDRKSRRKKNSIAPLSPSPRRAQLNSKPKECISVTPREASHEECDHFTVQTTPTIHVEPPREPLRPKDSLEFAPPSENTTPRGSIGFLNQPAKGRKLPLSLPARLLNAPLKRRSRSVGNLVMEFELERGRDSGFSESGSDSSVNDATLEKRLEFNPIYATHKRKKTHSAESIPTTYISSYELSSPVSLSNQPQPVASSTPSRPKQFNRVSAPMPPVKRATPDVTLLKKPSNLHASKLRSAQSMEVLTAADLDKMQQTTLSSIGRSQSRVSLSSSHATNTAAPPPVPKRSSSSLENCTISDAYLLSQGKRMSQMLQMTPKKERSTFRSLQAAFSKMGTLMKRNRSVSLDSTGHEVSPSSTSRRMLGSPSMLLGGSNTPATPIVRSVSKSSFDEVSEDNYIAVSSVTSIPQPKPKVEEQQEPPRNGRAKSPAYLTLLGEVLPGMPSPERKPRRNYENSGVEFKPENVITVDGNEENVYKLPSLWSGRREQEEDSDEPYENHHIQAGPKDTITLDGSPLHSYVTPSNFLGEEAPRTTPEALYGNNEIHRARGGGIGIGGDEVHVYHVPSVQLSPPSLSGPPPAPPPPPPPPPLPPKPGSVEMVKGNSHIRKSSLKRSRFPPVSSKPLPQVSTKRAELLSSSSTCTSTAGTGKKAPLVPSKPQGRNEVTNSPASTENRPPSPRPSSTPAISQHKASGTQALGPRVKSQPLPDGPPVVPRSSGPGSIVIPPLPPKPLSSAADSQPLEAPGYTKLYFGTRKDPPTTLPRFFKPPPPPGPPPPTGPPPPLGPPPPESPPCHHRKHPVARTWSGPEIMVTLKGTELSIKYQPLPDLPHEANRESGSYEEILSPPPEFREDSDDDEDYEYIEEYIDMSSEGVPLTSDNPATANPPRSRSTGIAKSFSEQLIHTLSDRMAQFKPHAESPPPALIKPLPLRPLKSPAVALTDPVSGPGGVQYRSWGTPVEEPCQDLNKRLKKWIDMQNDHPASDTSVSSNVAKREMSQQTLVEKANKAPIFPPGVSLPASATKFTPDSDTTGMKEHKKPPVPTPAKPAPQKSQSKGKLPAVPPTKPKSNARSPSPPIPSSQTKEKLPVHVAPPWNPTGGAQSPSVSTSTSQKSKQPLTPPTNSMPSSQPPTSTLQSKGKPQQSGNTSASSTFQVKGRIPLTPPMNSNRSTPSPSPPPTSQNKGKAPLTPPKAGGPPPPPPPPPLPSYTPRPTVSKTNSASKDTIPTRNTPANISRGELLSQELSKKITSLSNRHKT